METVSEENPKTEENIPESDKEKDKESTSHSDSISEYMPPEVRRQYLKEMVDALPPQVQNRLVVLKNMQLELLQIEAEYSNELFKLEKSYHLKHQLLYDKRTEIINGLNEEEVEEPPKSNESAEAIIMDAGEGDQVREPVPKDTKGIPGFWLSVFRNSAVLSQLIQPQDEAALAKLTDVVIKYNDDYSYTIEFHFDKNEFFSNSILTKQYFLKSAVNLEEPFEFDGSETNKCIGCSINWERRKNLTMKTIRRTQKNKMDGSIRNIVKQVPIDSFFNFFYPPVLLSKFNIDYDDDEADEIKQILKTDYNIGNLLRFKIIPKAVLYFTGDFVDNEDEDDEYEAEEEDDEKENVDDKCNADAEQPPKDQQDNEPLTNECSNQ